MEIIDVGEKVHIIERRYFESDPRRHFAGEVVRTSENTARVNGYVWVFDGGKNEFVKRDDLRDRVFVLGERMTINVLPKDVVIENLRYEHQKGRGLIVTDNKDYTLEIGEFSGGW